jgi:hypothetical protein
VVARIVEAYESHEQKSNRQKHAKQSQQNDVS